MLLVASPRASVDRAFPELPMHDHTGHCSLQTTHTASCVPLSGTLGQHEASSAISGSGQTSFCEDLYSGLHCSLRWLTATEFKPCSACQPPALCTPFSVSYICSSWECLRRYIYFPLQSRTSTLLFLTLRHPTQSHTGCLPNEKCIQQSSV